MGAPVGFFAPGLVKGTFTFAVLGVVAMLVAVSCFAKETPNITKADSRKLGTLIAWTATVCMWLMWACVYMHQMVPLINPVHVELVE
mmetsp:Transcript_71293/g.154895  ORF Transcript_71293/g.154895 Transcript_71293/m.154895 type:complete len:87 (-) Transcript_71293:75-335(-)